MTESGYTPNDKEQVISKYTLAVREVIKLEPKYEEVIAELKSLQEKHPENSEVATALQVVEAFQTMTAQVKSPETRGSNAVMAIFNTEGLYGEVTRAWFAVENKNTDAMDNLRPEIESMARTVRALIDAVREYNQVAESK